MLADRLNAGSMADIHAPPRPSWCNEEDISEPENSEDKSSANRKKGRDKQNDVGNEVLVVYRLMFLLLISLVCTVC